MLPCKNELYCWHLLLLGPNFRCGCSARMQQQQPSLGWAYSVQISCSEATFIVIGVCCSLSTRHRTAPSMQYASSQPSSQDFVCCCRVGICLPFATLDRGAAVACCIDVPVFFFSLPSNRACNAFDAYNVCNAQRPLPVCTQWPYPVSSQPPTSALEQSCLCCNNADNKNIHAHTRTHRHTTLLYTIEFLLYSKFVGQSLFPACGIVCRLATQRNHSKRSQT